MQPAASSLSRHRTRPCTFCHRDFASILFRPRGKLDREALCPRHLTKTALPELPRCIFARFAVFCRSALSRFRLLPPLLLRFAFGFGWDAACQGPSVALSRFRTLPHLLKFAFACAAFDDLSPPNPAAFESSPELHLPPLLVALAFPSAGFASRLSPFLPPLLDCCFGLLPPLKSPLPPLPKPLSSCLAAFEVSFAVLASLSSRFAFFAPVFTFLDTCFGPQLGVAHRPFWSVGTFDCPLGQSSCLSGGNFATWQTATGLVLRFGLFCHLVLV